MVVRNASDNDIYPIGTLLLAYYERKNSDFGYQRYLTSRSEATKTIGKRIQDKKSPLKYGVLVDGDRVIGYVSYGSEDEIGEILQLIIEPESLTETNVSTLLNWTLGELKNIGVERVYLEMSEMDQVIRSVFNSYNGKIVNLQGRIDLN